jgi:hypothetical protein
MKILILFCSFIISTNFAFSIAPQLPQDLENMDDAEKKEAGAFFLFYSLASQGLIGGKSGVCVNYEPGDTGGTPDRISLGIDSDSFATGKNDLDKNAESKVKSALGPLMSQVKTYLDGACKGSLDECKKTRSLSVDGYADAQPYISGVANLEKSISQNEALAGRRAGVYLGIIKNAGFSDFGEMQAAGHASPIGEYLREGQNPPLKYNPTNAKYNAKDFKVNCPERRVTVVNISYNGEPVDVSGRPGVISPTVMAASKNFIKLTNMAASIQTLKAIKEFGIKNITVEDVENGSQLTNKLIEKIMNNNGITDPATIESCKNYSTRIMLKESLDRFKTLSAAQQNDIFEQINNRGEKDILNGLGNTNKNSAGFTQNQSFQALMKKTPDGFVNSSRYPLVSKNEGGISTSPSDCFSAKNSLQIEVGKNSSLRQRICKPAKEFFSKGSKNVHVNYSPELPGGALHIGCQACQTGMRFVPDPNKPGSSVPVFIDREAGKNPAVASTLNNYQPTTSDELASYQPKVDSVKSYVNKFIECSSTRIESLDKEREKLLEILSKKRTPEQKERLIQITNEKNNITDGVVFFKKVTLATEFTSTNNPLKTTYTLKNSKQKIELSKFDDPIMSDFLKEISTMPLDTCGTRKEKKKLDSDFELKMDDLKAVTRVVDHYHNSPLGNREKAYMKVKLGLEKGGDESSRQRTVDYYEKVLIPNIVARNTLSNWNGNHSMTAENNFTFGGMKKPKYYVIPNCNCDDPNLIENAMKNGIAKVLDRVPADDNIAVSDAQNSCIFSPPVPSSCMYAPNEAGADGVDDKKEDNKIQWMGTDGKLVTSYLADLSSFMAENNKRFQLQDCQELTPQDVAQKVVDSVMCDGSRKIPQNDPDDCKK